MHESKSSIEIMEMDETMQKLREAGYSHLVDTLLTEEDTCYTRKGRLNKSGACRQLGCKPKQFEDMLLEMRELIAPDFGMDPADEDEEE